MSIVSSSWIRFYGSMRIGDIGEIPEVKGPYFGGSSHGDRKSPKDRVVRDPFQMAELYGL